MRQMQSNVNTKLFQAARCWLPAFLLLIAGSVQSQVLIPSGAQINLAGGSAQLACTDLLIHGAAVQGAGANTTGVRNLTVGSGGSLDMAGSSIQLAQQYNNNGTVSAAGGSLVRAGTPSCPAVGQLGAIAPNAIPVAGSAVPVPTIGSISLTLLVFSIGLIGGLRAATRGAFRGRSFP